MNVTAGTVNAGQQLGVAAGNDIRVQHGTDSTTLDQHYKATGSSGMLSKTRTESRDTVSQQSVNGSQLGGDSVLMQAGRDLTVTGSSVAGSARRGAERGQQPDPERRHGAARRVPYAAGEEERPVRHRRRRRDGYGSYSTRTTDVARSPEQRRQHRGQHRRQRDPERGQRPDGEGLRRAGGEGHRPDAVRR